MTARIVITQPACERLAERLVRDASAIAVCPVGTAHLPGLRTYLAREVNWIPHVVHSGDDLLMVRAAGQVDEIPRVVAREVRLFPPQGEGAALCLAFGRGRIAMGGAGFRSEQPFPLEYLTCVGPGLAEVRFGPPNAESESRSLPRDGQWSRTIGALALLCHKRRAQQKGQQGRC
jgi:hypothetical protein